ncbi:MAG: NAD(P)-dependent oxidoreductase [Pseudomonadota bacterium]|nr:NAD(P)-dependent oxidoreductase [Pseudomonadota bacterium]
MPDTARVLLELGRIDTFFPVLSSLGNRWAAARPFEGLTIGLHLHLTTLTATVVRELTLGGGRWICSAANPATTDPSVVAFLRDLGVEVYSGGGIEDGLEATVDADPTFFADVGFALGSRLVAAGRRPRAGVEITRSGITRLRAGPPLPFPVLNINDGRLKPGIENRHGVGEGLWQSYTALTGCHLAGRRVLVIGYGAVGAGVAAYARAGGASVEVMDVDPVRRLIAHYDGFPTPPPLDAVRRAKVMVTAGGVKHSLPLALLREANDGTVLINAGHGADEIDIEGLEAEADCVDQVGPRVVGYRLPGGPQLMVLAGGNPLNIVMNSGSQEPVLLHFAVMGLALEWLTRHHCAPGEVALPPELEAIAAEVALAVLG